MRVYRVEQQDGTVVGRVVEIEPDALSAGNVVVQVAYSSVNFKGARVATGTYRAPIQFPRTPALGGCDRPGSTGNDTSRSLRMSANRRVSGRRAASGWSPGRMT